MRRLLTYVLAVGSVLLFPFLLLAQSTSTTSSVGAAIVDPFTIDTPGEAFWLIEMMFNAFKSGEWALGAAFVLTLLIAAFRFLDLGKKVPKAWVPWVTGAVAMATSSALGLYAGLGWWAILTTGLTVGLVAVGGWETIGKLLKKLTSKKKAEEEKKPPEKEGGK